MADTREGATEPRCAYCGLLGWTVEKYGRVTHKQACPHRTDAWHQGDPKPEGASRYLSGERRRITPALLRRLDALHAAWEAEVSEPGNYSTDAFHAWQEAITDAGLALVTAAKGPKS